MDQGEIHSFYNNLVRKHGNDVQSLAWGSRETQFKRFEILAEVADLSGAKVLDVGCGLGDFYTYLKGRFAGISYTGVDLVEKMIETAQANHPEGVFITGDFLTRDLGEDKFDYAFASGIFNHRMPEQNAFVEKTIARMFEVCRRATAFNLLSDRAEIKTDSNCHANPEAMLEFCKQFSHRVRLRHDYLPHDFTIFIYRDPSEAES